MERSWWSQRTWLASKLSLTILRMGMIFGQRYHLLDKINFCRSFDRQQTPGPLIVVRSLKAELELEVYPIAAVSAEIL